MVASTQPERAIRSLSPADEDFPARLRSISSAPAELYLCGRVAPPPRVALVGARRSDDYGLDLARQLGERLARAGVCVVSGGAGGVDTAALEGALAGGGRPVAVLGTGCDVSYPAANRRLFDRLAEQGALLSEHPPGTQGLPFHFARRNRLISGLADGVVVVRAAARSGSLLTARFALGQGRKLMAVPGPAGQRLSAGCHLLLRSGARLVESAGDVLRELGLEAGQQPQLPLGPPAAERARLPGPQQELLRLLQGGQASVDQLARSSGLSASQVAASLLELELQGWVEQKPGMVYTVTRSSATSS
ncbi:MAG: DNA-protecting protein DprA [Deltaproteobacteria bacterium]|nr:MAG: DNA-protecting protein DprA [Deltaproteobacteria bacterium]